MIKVNEMRKFLLAFWFLFLPTLSAFAQFLTLPNQVNVSATTTVSYSTDTGLFTYSYSFTNYGDAKLEVSQIHLPLRGATISNVVSPVGWESSLAADGSLVNWCACSENGFTVPPLYVDDGRGLPSKFQIKPGATLNGFSFQSAFPQEPGLFYAGGWTPIPKEGIDFQAGEEPISLEFPRNLFSGSVAAVPRFMASLEFGGRRPSVDGFLVFTSLRDGGKYTSPVLIDLTFGQQNEIVDALSFKATLNGVDITNQFTRIDDKHLRARIEKGAILVTGKNVIQTVVNGRVPGSGRTAKDSDRLTFVIQ